MKGNEAVADEDSAPAGVRLLAELGLPVRKTNGEEERWGSRRWGSGERTLAARGKMRGRRRCDRERVARGEAGPRVRDCSGAVGPAGEAQ